MIQEEALKSAGLEANEVTVYLALLQLGSATAGQITTKTPLKRGTVYNVVRDLMGKNLVEEIQKEGASIFRLQHPSHLKELMRQKQEQLKEAERALDSVIPQIQSQYNISRNKPAVRFYEGEKGLRAIYQDIIQEGKKVHLVRASYDDTYVQKFQDWIVRFHIPQRIAKKIHVYTISSDDPQANRDPKLDAQRLVHRQWVSRKDYSAPVEVDIYGDKVAFLSFGRETIGFIIQSQQIAESMKQLFWLGRRGASAESSTDNSGK